MSPLVIYIGHDDREDLAYQVCRRSIFEHTPGDIVIRPIKHRELRQAGLFWREWRVDATGQYWDTHDGKPFSTQFSHSRFLTPYLARREFPQAKWAMFVDCDFMFRRDVNELFALARPEHAVMCVKHNQRPHELIKMDGYKQTSYPRKNWSSLVLFNLEHNHRLTPECINEADGAWLHQFEWLSEEQIGALPAGWNHLVTVEPEPAMVNAAHFTLGGPWFEEWPVSRFDDEWIRHANEVRFYGGINAPQTNLRAAQ